MGGWRTWSRARRVLRTRADIVSEASGRLVPEDHAPTWPRASASGREPGCRWALPEREGVSLSTFPGLLRAPAENPNTHTHSHNSMKERKMGVVAGETPRPRGPSAPFAGPARRTTPDFPFPNARPGQQTPRPGSPGCRGAELLEKSQRSKRNSLGAGQTRDLAARGRCCRVPFCSVFCIQHI